MIWIQTIPFTFLKGCVMITGMKNRSWKRLFKGKTPQEIEGLISAAKISYCMKSKLRRQYLRNGNKLTNEQRSQIYHECGEIGRNWNV